MIKRLTSLFSFLFFTLAASAQFTNVTGTIVDTDTTTWFNAKVTVTFVPNPNYPNQNQYNIAGVPINSSTYSAYLSQTVISGSNGVFAVTVLDSNQIAPIGSTWKFVIQSYTSASSSTFPNLSITGASQDVSSFLTANITAPRLPASNNYGGAYGYGTNEISVTPIPGGTFFNVTLGASEIWTCQDNVACYWAVNSLGSITCASISGCGTFYGFTNNVSVVQNPGDTTLTVGTPFSGLPSAGPIQVDGEREYYTGTSGSNTFTGIIRGYNQTTIATHNIGANVESVDINFSATNQIPTGGIYGYPAFGVSAQILTMNCLNPVLVNDEGALPVISANCGSSQTWIDQSGRIHQAGLGTIANFMSPIYIGGTFGDEPNNAGLPVPILNTTYLVQTNNGNQLSSAIGVTPGIASPVKAIQSPTLAAPILTNAFIGAGSCSVTYVITGVDSDGGVIPGTAATMAGLASTWGGVAGVLIQAPMAGGVVTYNLYRTIVSGCGTLNTGKIGTSSSGQFATFTDNYITGDGTTAPVTNTTIPKLCTNNEQFCILSGTTVTPPIACSSAYSGWEYQVTNATVRPFKEYCIANNWVDAQQNTVGSTATTANPTSVTTANGLVTAITAGFPAKQQQVLLITTGICTTGTTASSTCTMSPVSWPNTFTDTNYAVTCTSTAPSTGLQVNFYAQKTATSIIIQLQNGQGSAAVATTVGEIDCIGVHN